MSKNDSMKSGTVKSWKEDRGFGFIQTASGTIFFHISALVSKSLGVKEGDEVEFRTMEGERGLRAVDVRLLRRAEPQRKCPERYAQRCD
jgi:CspA family cold shock protein